MKPRVTTSYKLIFSIRNLLTVLLSLFTLLACQNSEQGNSLESGYLLKSVPFNKVNLEDNFWKPRLTTQAKTLVPFALDKTIPAVENLEKAAKYLKGDTTDLPFAHRFISSDLYKVMEGAALILMENPNPELEKRMDGIIDIIGAAQKEDGYLYVAHITGVSKNHDQWGGGGMGDKPYSFVVHSHELYNMGHMYEGAIAYYQATGKDKWLKIAEKNAVHINRIFFVGDENYNNGKPINQAPGHEELELALAKLYRVTGKQLYLDMAKKFLDIRGRTYQPEGDGVMAPAYAQQHKPVTEQEKAVGHAVRATYLYSGMADVGVLTGSKEYNPALDKIWHNLVDTKMHITGGLGAVHGIEGFGPEYVLPNKEAYNETCAAVGNVFFNYRMFLLHQDARYMDVAEVALLNNALAGVNMEGNKFFYVNPLETDGKTPFSYGLTGRSPWFGTACCPSNIARLMPQVPGMMYAHTDDEIYVSFYAGTSTTILLKSGEVKVNQATNYPFDENINIEVSPEKVQDFTLKLRIPSWARGQFVPGKLYNYVNDLPENWSVKVNGEQQNITLDKGFAAIKRTWKPGDKVELHLPMPVRFNHAIDSVEADINRVAITKGPLVYCAEEVDNNGLVQRFFVDKIPDQNSVSAHRFEDGVLKDVVNVDIPAKAKEVNGIQETTVKLVPYYAWDNRGDESMIVWFPEKEDMVYVANGNELLGGKFKSVKASSTSDHGSLEAISNNRQPANSQDNTIPVWISEKGKAQWVEVELEETKTIRNINVYWFAAHGAELPQKWSLEVKKNGKWVPFNLYTTDSYATQRDQYNQVHPSGDLSCDGIRINIVPQNDAPVGILDVNIQYEE
ncbi:MAG: hypothetical protein CMO01_03295 [Thalassobius sp.]|nr:hypothetical protein [Thalassovita sp.]